MYDIKHNIIIIIHQKGKHNKTNLNNNLSFSAKKIWTIIIMPESNIQLTNRFADHTGKAVRF